MRGISFGHSTREIKAFITALIRGAPSWPLEPTLSSETARTGCFKIGIIAAQNVKTRKAKNCCFPLRHGGGERPRTRHLIVPSVTPIPIHHSSDAIRPLRLCRSVEYGDGIAANGRLTARLYTQRPAVGADRLERHPHSHTRRFRCKLTP